MNIRKSLLSVSVNIRSVLMFMGYFGICLIICFGFSNIKAFLPNVAQCLLLGAAIFMLGLFVGFLFGIPKNVSKNASGTYTSNTNLEEISDWLTKILVGLGLTQISFIPTKVESIVAYLSERMKNVPQSIILSLLLYLSSLDSSLGI
ncbi:MAG: hypothetical protein JWQ28_1753 [Pedobacter sp.]|jgi:hypothetical protein|nr:hypothetical protein [Pedobacter sp.]